MADDITPQVLKECASELKPVLARLFGLCLKYQTFSFFLDTYIDKCHPKEGLPF